MLNGTTLLVQLKPGLDAAVFAAPTTSNLLVGADFQATRIDGLFQLNVDDANLSAVTNLLRNNYSIAYAEPQTTFSVQLTPNDPSFTNGTLFGLNGAYGIDAPLAWDTTTGTTTPVVAVIDTGVDYRHVDLYRNICSRFRLASPSRRALVRRSSHTEVRRPSPCDSTPTALVPIMANFLSSITMAMKIPSALRFKVP